MKTYASRRCFDNVNQTLSIWRLRLPQLHQIASTAAIEGQEAPKIRSAKDDKECPTY